MGACASYICNLTYILLINYLVTLLVASFLVRSPI